MQTINITAVSLFTCSGLRTSFRQVGCQVPDSNLSVAGRRDSLHPSLLPFWAGGILLSVGLIVLSISFTPTSKLDHRQACCAWLINSPKRSKSPSTQAPFCRHFCTVSSCPRSPACTRRDAIWRAEPQTVNTAKLQDTKAPIQHKLAQQAYLFLTSSLHMRYVWYL